MQQQTPTQALQPASSTPISTISKVGTSTLYRLGWQQVVLAIGLLAISGVGTALVFKKAIIPRLKSWIRKVVSEEDEESKSISKPSLAEEAAAAAKSGAAADVARVNQDMLILKNGGVFDKYSRLSLRSSYPLEASISSQGVDALSNLQSLLHHMQGHSIQCIASGGQSPNFKFFFAQKSEKPSLFVSLCESL